MKKETLQKRDLSIIKRMRYLNMKLRYLPPLSTSRSNDPERYQLLKEFYQLHKEFIELDKKLRTNQ